MASLLCMLFGSLNAKHNPFPSTMGLFILSNKPFRVLFLIAASSSSAIGRLILPINLRHGIDNVKSRNLVPQSILPLIFMQQPRIAFFPEVKYATL